MYYYKDLSVGTITPFYMLGAAQKDNFSYFVGSTKQIDKADGF